MLDQYRKVSVEEEFKKNPELKKEDIDSIREWLDDQDCYPDISDSEIILFLHSNYYDLEATKATIKKYFECRTHYTEFFSDFDLKSDTLVQVSETM